MSPAHIRLHNELAPLVEEGLVTSTRIPGSFVPIVRHTQRRKVKLAHSFGGSPENDTK